MPSEFVLRGKYPNPFNPATRIVFDLPWEAKDSVQVIDLHGREVVTLSSGRMEAGANRVISLGLGALA